MSTTGLGFTRIGEFLENFIEGERLYMLEQDRDDRDLDDRFEKIWDKSNTYFDKWFHEQVGTIEDLVKDAAPSRTGNLASAIEAMPIEGGGFAVEVNAAIAPYWRHVEEGRGRISSPGVIRFSESRQRWTSGGRTGSNASGPGSGRYPYMGTMKKEGSSWFFGEKARLAESWKSTIGPAPAIPFRQTGFDDYQLHGFEDTNVNQIVQAITAIILESGCIPSA